MSFGYLAVEVRRVLRSTRFLIFSVVFPVLLFLLYVGIFAAGDRAIVGILMVNMTAFGALSATLFAGGRLAVERSAGWQRQLRLTPLTGAGYLTAKGVTAMLLALPAVVLVPLIGGVAEGVALDAAGWMRVTVGIWLAVIPFALIGLLIGQLGTPDGIQPIMSLTMMVMSLLGGIFIPVDTMPPWLLDVAQILPSYWLGQVGRGAVTTDLSVDLGKAVLVLAVWTVAVGIGVIRRYRRDSARV
ncbi:MAG: ABC transporter permease [Actinophytocola sp.]|uniref:ABC transporter permease n=1 Tax=Actinophytocola sp. TaxID=1872138 RepID=UPI003C75E2FB